MPILWRIRDFIQDRWEVYDIKQGGMGVVYIVFDHEWGEVLAAKTFRRDHFVADSKLAARFAQESAAWIHLDAHENVVRARFVQVVSGQVFLFLEYVAGGDLAGWIGTPRLMANLPQVLRFAVHFCDGMSHALTHGISAHRDIKPANCLITQEGTLKVTDFGLARTWAEGTITSGPRGDRTRAPGQHLTQTGLGGTLPYMSPEQFDDFSRVDVRSDIYSFGVLLWEMLTGELPFFTSSRDPDVWQRLHRESAVALLSGNASALNPLIGRCLAKQPVARYSNFEELRGELSAYYLRLTGQTMPRATSGAALNVVQLQNKGASLSSLGLHNEALVCFDKALALEASLAVAWANKGTALTETGQLVDALGCYDQALKLNPNLLLAWTNKGNLLAKAGRFAEALECHDRALSINPLDVVSWVNKGVSLYDSGLSVDALACFDRALELNPRADLAWSNKGMSLAVLGKYDEALKCLDRTFELNPSNPIAWTTKGTVLDKAGDMPGALVCYDHALRLNPHWARAWAGKGCVLGKIGRPEDALRCLDHALEINPSLAEAWTNKGAALDDLRRHSEALICHDRALALNPNYALAWNNKGSCLGTTGRHADALACFKRSVELAPADAQAWGNRGQALANLGRRAEALVCFDHALQIDHQSAPVLFKKGVTLMELGRRTEAIRCLEHARGSGHKRAAEALAFYK